jgi:hypothetical protein
MLDFDTMDRTFSERASSINAPDYSRLQRSNSNVPVWDAMSREQADSYCLFSETSPNRQYGLQPFAEVATYTDEDVTGCTEPSNSSPFMPHSHRMHLQLTPNLQWASSSDGSTSPSTPSTALLTPITHSSNPMSRQSSYNTSFLDDNSMLCVQSDPSCMLPILSEDGTISFSPCVESNTISACADSSSFLSFTGPANEHFLSPSQSVSASVCALASSENNKSYLVEDMRRSASTTSNESSMSDASAPSSICTRQSRREREINAQALARKIAPKAIDLDEQIESVPSNAQMARIRSRDGSSKTFGVLPKTPYVRPQHPKILCPHCSERPDGFRGTHELERHVARAHASTRKGYICVDHSRDQKFLANCKHCRNKKVYGAYYNAAAHLRRAHFHPRKRGRKGKNDEKRGGIGGGDDPPMDHLKAYWIREVEVANKPTPSSPESGSDDAPEPDNSYDANYDDEASYAPQQSMPSSMNMQVPIDPSQYFDYGMAPAGEPLMYDAPQFVEYDTSVAAQKDISNFQFDAEMYMTQ